MSNAVPSYARQRSDQLGFLLRRAEQESIAAIRSLDAPASDCHRVMATAYSLQAVRLLAANGAADT